MGYISYSYELNVLKRCPFSTGITSFCHQHVIEPLLGHWEEVVVFLSTRLQSDDPPVIHLRDGGITKLSAVKENQTLHTGYILGLSADAGLSAELMFKLRYVHTDAPCEKLAFLRLPRND